MCDEQVNRCVCIGKHFDELKAFGDFETAQRETRCAVECGGCEPYIKLMFASGETSFDVDDPRLQAFE